MSANEWVRKLEAYNIAQAREPNPEDPAYRDKQLNEEYKRINNPQRPPEQKPKTQGEQLRESGQYLPDHETEDISKPVNYWEGNETGWSDDEAIELIEGLLGDYDLGPEGNPLGPEVYAPERKPNLVPDSGRWPRSAFNVPLQSSPSFDIDPKTQRQNVRDRKIENRAKSKDQGADIAKGKLRPEQKIDIPPFLKSVLDVLPGLAAAGGSIIWQLLGPRGMFQLSELNPAQIEALKGIPANLKDLPDVQRLQKMREITKKVKGLA